VLPKEYRIKEGKEYAYLYRTGKKANGRYIFIYFINNDFLFNRFGIVTSKRVGNAVIRNKVKRRLRAIIQANPFFLEKQINMIIVAKKNSNQANYKELEKDFLEVMKKAKILC